MVLDTALNDLKPACSTLSAHFASLVKAYTQGGRKCEAVPRAGRAGKSLLEQIDDAHFCQKRDESKWSKKEILGHLIDSATNNHHRFIRAQFEDNPKIIYNQDDWAKYSYYQTISKKQVILLWQAYNLQIIELVLNLPEKVLKRKANDLTLEFLIDDYVKHLEHHLKQIVSYT